MKLEAWNKCLETWIDDTLYYNNRFNFIKFVSQPLISKSFPCRSALVRILLFQCPKNKKMCRALMTFTNPTVLSWMLHPSSTKTEPHYMYILCQFNLGTCLEWNVECNSNQFQDIDFPGVRILSWQFPREIVHLKHYFPAMH